jgi:hypothetical protein
VEDAIHLFTQFFTHKDAQRRKEIKFCLNQNSMNPRITKSICWTRKYTPPPNWACPAKIVQSNKQDSPIKISQNTYGKIDWLDISLWRTRTFFHRRTQNLFVSELSTKKTTVRPTAIRIRRHATREQVKTFGPRAESNDVDIPLQLPAHRPARKNT